MATMDTTVKAMEAMEAMITLATITIMDMEIIVVRIQQNLS